jgi:hypothetical protein
MCNITCIYNEIGHITNEIFQAQITSYAPLSFLIDAFLNHLQLLNQYHLFCIM